MAKHIPLCPFKLGNNDAYRHVLDTFEKDHQARWDLEFLYEQFFREEVDVLFTHQILFKEDDDYAVLSFNRSGTLAYWVKELVKTEIHSVHGLLDKFPKQARCSSQRLIHIISFLFQFHQVDFVVWPDSGLTCVVPEPCPDWMERGIDSIYWASKDLEIKYVYQIAVDDTVQEFLKLRE